ncbi:MAG: sulfatase-like hydrolase/transferase, partial [Chloroflexi bacterium]|nr:sulfatase-like hydrolase/transferase [Chloroflexota bacterium]
AHLDGTQLTSGQVFRDAGYTTAYFGKTHFGTTLERLGYDVGNDHRVPGLNSAVDEEYVRAARAFLAEHDPRRPLFLTVSVNQPHPPFEFIPQFAGQYPVERMRIPESFYRDDLSTKPAFQRAHALDGHHGTSSEATLRTEIAQYCSMISNVDRLFAEVRQALEARGMWEETVVLFTSDHGDMMGAHRTRLKGTLPYEELYNVPMILRLPGGPHGQVISDLVVNTAVPGTLIEAAGLPLPNAFHGGSLLPRLQGPDHRQEERVFFEHYGAYWGLHPFRAVRRRARDADWKYVKYYGPDATEELYDLVADPLELVNRAQDAACHDIRTELEREVDGWWQRTGGRDFAYYESAAFKHRGADTLVVPGRTGPAAG